MWDADQLAEIPVIVDRLLALGDPLGEWLAVRSRLDAGGVARPERQQLRRRARLLRGQLGSRLVLAEDPELGRPHVVRELGLICEVQLDQATPARLAALLGRADAPFVLRLHLVGDAASLRACVELLITAEPRPELAVDLAVDLGGTRDSLRQLELVGADEGLRTELMARRDELGARLPSLYMLHVDAQAIALPFASAALDHGDRAWTPARRSELGRALGSPAPSDRRRALERLYAHSGHAGQLGAALLAIIDRDPEPSVRAAAFAIVPGLGSLAHSIIALAADAARGRDDPQLHAWLERVRAG